MAIGIGTTGAGIVITGAVIIGVATTGTAITGTIATGESVPKPVAVLMQSEPTLLLADAFSSREQASVIKTGAGHRSSATA